ncbi:MAG: DUF429 domain-containing protein [Phycisphaerales bacterium]
MKYLMGFDPGGGNHFGWCVVKDRREWPLGVVDAGIADHAAGAVEAAYEAVPKGASVIGVGIDAPLFWVANGCRAVDNALRERIRCLGAPHAAGTVQQVNSLRGACLVQGMLAGVLSRQCTPGVPISESHPKAMLWLLGHNPVEIKLPGLGDKLILPHDWHQADVGDHLRDAGLTCLSAWAMVHEPPEWEDILAHDRDEKFSLITPLPGYWMPRCSSN